MHHNFLSILLQWTLCLVIVDYSTVKIVGQVSFWYIDKKPFKYVLKSDGGHIILLFFCIEIKQHWLMKWLLQPINPSNNVREIPFPYILAIICFLGDSHSCEGIFEMKSQSNFTFLPLFLSSSILFFTVQKELWRVIIKIFYVLQ